MVKENLVVNDQMIDQLLDERIATLEIELKQLKRARNARKAKISLDIF